MNIFAALLIVSLTASAALPVRGVVFGLDGKPAADTDVFMTSSSSPGWFLETRTTARGEFTLIETPDNPHVTSPSGDYIQVIACKAGKGSQHISLRATVPSMDPLTLKLQATLPTILKVLDPQQKPLAGVEVQVLSINHDKQGHFVYTAPIRASHFRSRTNGQGEVTFLNLPNGDSYGLEIKTEAFGTQRHFLNNHQSTIQLHPVGKLRGKLKSSVGYGNPESWRR